jgi:translation initiation factor IF-3
MCIYICIHIFYFWEGCNIFKELAVNGKIIDREVRLIDENGKQLGVMSKTEALRIAEFRNFDLVNISPNAKPPVCKIMDYGKFRFEMIKKDKEARKAQKIVEIKEIKLSQTIDVGDINVRLKQTREFLTEGNRIKISIRMTGRELAHSFLSVKVLNDFFDKIKDIAVMEKAPVVENRFVFMMVAPIAKKQ